MASGQLQEIRRTRGDPERNCSRCASACSVARSTTPRPRLRLESAIERLRTDYDVEPAVALDAPAPGCPTGRRSRVGPASSSATCGSWARSTRSRSRSTTRCQERHQFLPDQLEDVKASRRELSRVIRAVDREIVTVFEQAFHDVTEHFTALFTTLFPGGAGRLMLIDPDDMLDTGIEIEARPSGKNVRRLSLLSGGERSLTALAFLFAVFRARPSPFYLLDEVEAALDDVNLHRFLDLVHEFRDEAQLLDRVAPEAHDGGRRLPLRRLDAAGRVEPGRQPARPRRRRRAAWPDSRSMIPPLVLAASAVETRVWWTRAGRRANSVALLDRLPHHRDSSTRPRSPTRWPKPLRILCDPAARVHRRADRPG